jgi:hypothetical protein
LLLNLENLGRGNRLDNKFFDDVLESETKTLSDEQLANSIKRLSKMLQRFHGAWFKLLNNF